MRNLKAIPVVLFTVFLTILIIQVSCKKDSEENNTPTAPVYTNGEGDIGVIGGTVKVDNVSSPINGAYVKIPANALTENTFIQIYEIPNDVSFFGDSRIVVVGFKPSGLLFNLDVEIGVPYPDDIDAEILSAFFYNENEGKVYQEEINSINTDKTIVALFTNHFSGYFSGWDGLPCPGVPTIEHGGKIYNTVHIGGQCWFKENLSIGTMIIGQEDPTNNGEIEKYCYDDNPDNCETYGGLYNWDEMLTYSTIEGIQGICPYGWHIPRTTAYQQLATYLGGVNVAGGELITGGGSNFVALFTGYKADDSQQNQFYELGTSGSFWTSSKNQYAENIWWGLFNSSSAFSERVGTVDEGRSVRCLQNYIGWSMNSPPDEPDNPNPPDNEINVPIYIELSWTCTDPDNDPLTFDIYFGTSSNPPIEIQGHASTNYSVGQLDYNTTYYWKIVAKDDHDHETPGPVWSFTTIEDSSGGLPCPGTPTVYYHGQTYNTVLIGSQCWMKENLNYETGNSWCYNNDTSNCNTYGRLYDWIAIMNGEASSNSVPSGVQGICPNGWHLPSDEEWKILEG
ncbi:MAG: hypothetical protein K8R68_12075, partial [Bacteroidales bacterium]|nr:hypothetical protein [Bacteroidales bacterium]